MANKRTYTDDALIEGVKQAQRWADVMEHLGKSRSRNPVDVRAAAARLGIDTSHLDRFSMSIAAVSFGEAPPPNPSGVGTRTEAIVLAALVRAGRVVLLPFGGGHRYDIAVDDNGKLIRVQCKTAVYRNGCVTFKTHSRARDDSEISYAGFADVFGVHCPQLDKVYLVPVEGTRLQSCYLRVDAPKNHRVSGVRYADQYELLPS